MKTIHLAMTLHVEDSWTPGRVAEFIQDNSDWRIAEIAADVAPVQNPPKPEWPCPVCGHCDDLECLQEECGCPCGDKPATLRRMIEEDRSRQWEEEAA